MRRFSESTLFLLFIFLGLMVVVRGRNRRLYQACKLYSRDWCDDSNCPGWSNCRTNKGKRKGTCQCLCRRSSQCRKIRCSTPSSTEATYGHAYNYGGNDNVPNDHKNSPYGNLYSSNDYDYMYGYGNGKQNVASKSATCNNGICQC